MLKLFKKQIDFTNLLSETDSNDGQKGVFLYCYFAFMGKLMVKPRKSATFQSEHKLKTQHLKGNLILHLTNF